MPRQMLPAATTIASSTLSSTRGSATSSAIRCTTAHRCRSGSWVGERLPDSLRMTRRDWLSAIRADASPRPPSRVRTGRAWRCCRVARRACRCSPRSSRRLLQQPRVLVERVEAALDRTFELGLGDLVAALLLDDAFSRSSTSAGTSSREVAGCRERDVQRDLVRDLARLLVVRGDAGDLDQHRDGAASFWLCR